MKIVQFLVSVLIMGMFLQLPAVSIHGENEADLIDRGGELENNVNERNQRNQQLEQEAKVEVDEHRQRVCERRQIAANRRIAITNQLLSSQQSYLSSTFERLQKFVSAQTIQPTNYQELLAAVEEAKMAAAAAIAATDDSGVVVDCAKDNNQSDANNFKSNVRESIQALKQYRDSLKSLLQAVREAL